MQAYLSGLMSWDHNYNRNTTTSWKSKDRPKILNVTISDHSMNYFRRETWPFLNERNKVTLRHFVTTFRFTEEFYRVCQQFLEIVYRNEATVGSNVAPHLTSRGKCQHFGSFFIFNSISTKLLYPWP